MKYTEGVFNLVLSVESVKAVHQPTTERVQDKGRS
jgi:hypothetical protein